MSSRMGALVENVTEWGAAREGGLLPGDRVLRVDGTGLLDAIDWMLAVAEEGQHLLEVDRGGRRFRLTIDTTSMPDGVTFAEPVFDGVRNCNNECVFCFVDQLPGGLRESLYVKDDDYRLSFLCGNFVTLTNLSAADLERIIDLRLSPLYVSLHSTDPELRPRLFGNPEANRALSTLEALLSESIEVHLQIVLMRGFNDGAALERTLYDISQSYSGVSSVGIVPVGVSLGGRSSVPEEWAHDATSAKSVLEQLAGWSRVLGDSGPFAADEFYFLAGLDVPVADNYGGYPQLENGIGMTRSFLDEFADALTEGGPFACAEGSCVITTPMGHWALDQAGLRDLGARLVSCDNSLFGPRVNVCGLLPGGDVRRGLETSPAPRRAFLPAVATDGGGRFLDGVSAEELETESGFPLVLVPGSGRSLVEALRWGEER